MPKKKFKIMIASTVYGFEDQIYQIASNLNSLGFNVLNSHIGTIRVNPNLSNLENCLNAVEECDFFLGIIRPYYGTGNIDEINITFEEIKRAVALKKPYWFLVHRDVVFARTLFNKMSIEIGGIKIEGEELRNCINCGDKRFFDKRSLDIYEYVIQNHIPITLRNGNWAQEFYRLDELLTYINTQFSDKNFVEEIINSTQNG